MLGFREDFESSMRECPEGEHCMLGFAAACAGARTTLWKVSQALSEQIRHGRYWWLLEGWGKQDQELSGGEARTFCASQILPCTSGIQSKEALPMSLVQTLFPAILIHDWSRCQL